MTKPPVARKLAARHTKLVCLTASFLATDGFKFQLFQNACMVYKHAYLKTLMSLHSTFILSVVKMPLKGEVGGHALNSHGNYIGDQGKSWKNHGIVFLNFCGNPESDCRSRGREFDPCPVPYFLEDLSWNDFYSHSPPSTDSRRVVISCKRKYEHKVLIGRPAMQCVCLGQIKK